jgi:hypothetical protein
MTRIAAVTALAVLALCAGAAAHNLPAGQVNPYVSVVERIAPPAPGVFARVLGQDDRLQLRSSGTPLVVLGYQGEPYLRFERGGVFRNANSPATYANRDRYGAVKVPATAKPDAKPRWTRVSTRTSYTWHDHRIHWMSKTPPPVVRADSSEPHHVFDWRIPIRLDGAAHAIVGTLDYTPPPKTGGWTTEIAVGVAVGLTLFAIVCAFITVRVLRRHPR